MKKLSFFIIIAVLILTSFTNIFAAEHMRIVDDADLLSDAQEKDLLSYIDKVSEQFKFDLVIVTVNSLNGKTATEFADDFFDFNGYGYGADKDGALFLISIEDRDWSVSTCGDGVDIYTESLLDTLESSTKSKLSNNNFYDAFKLFISISEDALIDFNTFPLLSRVIISLLVGFVIAFIVVSTMKKQLNTVQMQIGAKVYTKAGSMNITASSDIFLYSHVTRRARPKNNGNTHTSSSGRSHGGRSGKF